MVVDDQVFKVPLSNIDSTNGRWNLKDDNSAQAVYMGSWQKLFKELKVHGKKATIPKGAELVQVFYPTSMFLYTMFGGVTPRWRY